jgi:uncharacterized protein (TIGR03000 family)
MYPKMIGLAGTLLLATAALLWTGGPLLAQHGGGHGGGGHGGFGGGRVGFGGGAGFSGLGGYHGYGAWHAGAGRYGAGLAHYYNRGYGRAWYGGYYPGYYSSWNYPYYGYGDSYDLGDYPYYGYSERPYYTYGTFTSQPYYFGSGIKPDSTSSAGSSNATSVAPPVRDDSAAVPAAGPAHDDTAHVEVFVRPDAQVWFENRPTTQTGSVRNYVSPPLDPKRSYTYDIRARWNENGHEVEQTRIVDVHAGGQVAVDFGTPTASQPETHARTGTVGS